MTTRKVGKRRIRSEMAPESPIHLLGTRGVLFTEADIPALAQTAGLPLADGADPKQLAGALDSAFTTALGWHGTVVREPAPQKLHDFLATVEQQAIDLLKTLRIPGEPGPGELDADSQGWYLHVAAGVDGDKPPMFWVRAPDTRYRDYLFQAAHDETSHPIPPAKRPAAFAVAANRAVLVGVPTMLRTLAAAARASRALQPARPKRTGRRSSVLNPSLFYALYLTHRAMFGTDPVTRNGESDREGPGITWAKEVIGLAVQRIAAVLNTPNPHAVDAIKALKQLDHGGIGALLEKARAFAKDQPAT